MSARAPSRVLVSGPGRGIGRAIALAFAGSGNRVALVGRGSDALDATARDCEALDAEVTVHHADVRDETAVRAAVSGVASRFGGIDVAVNNAGIGRYAPFAELSGAEWAEMVDVNVLGVANVIRAVLPLMTAQGSGHIVNIGSIRGMETIAGTTAYAATKFAVVGLSRALQQDLAGTGVRVSVVSPGGVKTDFGGIDAAAKHPGFLEPDAVARAVLAVVETGRHGWVSDLTILPDP
jgi:3-oxoacyl-[acyl-carrier protein] reductase